MINSLEGGSNKDGRDSLVFDKEFKPLSPIFSDEPRIGEDHGRARLVASEPADKSL